jgi:serine/threonine-protein kinase
MEFLDGEPLDRRLDRLGRISPADTARIMVQVCRALTNAHSVGIVHRDLKPENVFLVWDPEDQADIVKVVDFGIAKITETGAGISSATRTGSVLGTPYYMSPEQARGLRSVDYRTDLWSLGVIAYRCIVGRLPFDGEAVGDLLVKICTSPLPVPSQVASDITPAFDAWFAKALQREPAERFQSAAALAEALLVACGTNRGAAGSIAEGTVPSHPGAMVTPGGPPWPQSNAMPAQTAAGITVSVKSPPKGVLVAAILGVLAVLGVGSLIALKVMGGSEAQAAASATSEPAAAAPQPVTSQTLEPLPEVVPEAPASAVPVAAASASAPAPKPAVTPRPTSRPSTKPSQPKNPPAGTPKPKDRPIDVGY